MSYWGVAGLLALVAAIAWYWGYMRGVETTAQWYTDAIQQPTYEQRPRG